MSSTITAIRNILVFIKNYNLYSSIVMLTIGIIGNVLNIVMFTSSKPFRGNLFSFYFTIESIVNTNIIVLNLLSQLVPITDTYSIWCRLRTMLGQIFLPFSLVLICFAAIDQFFSTSPIPYLRRRSSQKTSQIYAGVACCLWILHSIPAGIFTHSFLGVTCYSVNAVYASYQLYFYYPVILASLPMSVSSLFALLAYRNVRHIVRRQVPLVRRRLDYQMTALAFVRVILFIISYLPYISFYIYWSATPLDRTNYVQMMTLFAVGTVIYSILLLNHAMTFYVFLLVSARFRRQVKNLFVKRLWRRCKQLYKRKLHNEIHPLREISAENVTDNE
ncbi:unnamed protein product [Adineta ricciae]|uniref:G-protein coupled receptors family 1 profile domain-containing protein n=1 Tax=Adineta ricciae TaxID=249248 RepID=A0A814MWP1_ADIRI|nr:unnamed protein product [Adineta ricciae]CAF1103525.1 unnamed protein product [Adineta ricciae]